MRHGSTVFPTLLALGLGLGGFARQAHGGEPTDGRLGQRTVSIFLLSRADVQADLKLNTEQIVECRRAALAFQRKASRLVGRKDPGVVAARREIDEELSEWLSKHLSAEQFGRFEQIDLQWEGAAAMLSRPFLDESLNLTPSQKKNVADCLAQSKVQRARGGWTYDDHIKLTRAAIAVLNDTQRDLWIHLLGPHCRFTIAAQAPLSPGQPVSQANANASTPKR